MWSVVSVVSVCRLEKEALHLALGRTKAMREDPRDRAQSLPAHLLSSRQLTLTEDNEGDESLTPAEGGGDGGPQP